MDSASFQSEYNLNKLSKVLNYQLSSILLFFLSFFVFIFIFLAALASVIFIPYMLYILFNEKKYGWIIFFALIVILPVFTILILWSSVPVLKLMLLVIIGVFYFYCFILRVEVNNWAKETRAKNEYLINKLHNSNDENTI